MITSKAELKHFINEDTKRWGHNLKSSNSLKDRIYNCFYKKMIVQMKYECLLRKAEYYFYKKETSKLPLLYNILYYIILYRHIKLGNSLGFTIPINVVDSGLMLPHTGTIVISHLAKIGKNCIIHTCVNIGKNKEKAPVIGDNVYIGPGAKLVGEIVIGNNVIIGAGAVVTKSFPDNVVIAGVPAKIVKYK